MNQKSSIGESITIDDLREYFHLPLYDAAKKFGIGMTLLRRLCRKYNIKKWPYRQIESLCKIIQSLEIALLDEKLSSNEQYHLIEKVQSLKLKLDAIRSDPNSAANFDESDDQVDQSRNGRNIVGGLMTESNLDSTSLATEINMTSNYECERGSNVMNVLSKDNYDYSESIPNSDSRCNRKRKKNPLDSMQNYDDNIETNNQFITQDVIVGCSEDDPNAQLKPCEQDRTVTESFHPTIHSQNEIPNESLPIFISSIELPSLECKVFRSKRKLKKLIPMMETSPCDHYAVDFTPNGALLSYPIDRHDSETNSEC